MIVVGVVVVVAVLTVAAYAGLRTDHGSPASSSPGTVLVPAGTLYQIPFENYNAVLVTLSAGVTVTGTITNVGGAIVYLMNYTQYRVLFNSYNASRAGYEWTSGAIQSDTYYELTVAIPVGQWEIVFANSVAGNSTAIGFYSNLVES